MSILANFLFTLSTFTKIPTPQIAYNEKNTKYTFFCLPLVGLVLGVIYFVVFTILTTLINETIIVAIALFLVNIVVTGGIHFDGYIDSMDAFKSYRNYEEKKRIIKDSTIGAFGLIYFFVAALLYFIMYYYLVKYNLGIILLIIPIISRTLILLLVCNNAKEKNDMLDNLISEEIEKRYLIFVFLYLIIIIGLALLFGHINIFVLCLALLGSALIYTIYFNRLFKLHFKEMNGDLCGYFIIMVEVIAPLVFIVFALLYN
ncbi:adenosylcobinamide-GDP ribazoletransferase [Erysipelotrichaceae bacterium OttesenSCG-928-M19]|nr:adenosylcobinamide-GDP ribazoletransferase [Erysipelotrichaceae bacterium OttesenSCG-928-M19]